MSFAEEEDDDPFKSIGGTHQERQSRASPQDDQIRKTLGLVTAGSGGFIFLLGLLFLSIWVMILGAVIAGGGYAVYDGRAVNLLASKLQKK
ncbi:MAG: hypothetical protein AB7K24_10045 [Gemmataceae bacterium]